MEYDKADSTVDYDQGYSEKQSSLDIEDQPGAWKNIKFIPGFNTYSRSDRIFLAYQSISNRLHTVLSSFLNGARQEEEKILKELKELRIMQDILVNCLLWEQNGQLEEAMVPKEIWELIK